MLIPAAGVPASAPDPRSTDVPHGAAACCRVPGPTAGTGHCRRVTRTTAATTSTAAAAGEPADTTSRSSGYWVISISLITGSCSNASDFCSIVASNHLSTFARFLASESTPRLQLIRSIYFAKSNDSPLLFCFSYSNKCTITKLPTPLSEQQASLSPPSL